MFFCSMYIFSHNASAELHTVQSKVMKHLLHVASNKKNGTLDIGGSATAELLSLLRSSTAFHNVLLRHHLFSFLQVLAGRYKDMDPFHNMFDVCSSWVHNCKDYFILGNLMEGNWVILVM